MFTGKIFRKNLNINTRYNIHSSCTVSKMFISNNEEKAKNKKHSEQCIPSSRVERHSF